MSNSVHVFDMLIIFILYYIEGIVIPVKVGIISVCVCVYA